LIIRALRAGRPANSHGRKKKKRLLFYPLLDFKEGSSFVRFGPTERDRTCFRTRARVGASPTGNRPAVPVSSKRRWRWAPSFAYKKAVRHRASSRDLARDPSAAADRRVFDEFSWFLLTRRRTYATEGGLPARVRWSAQGRSYGSIWSLPSYCACLRSARLRPSSTDLSASSPGSGPRPPLGACRWRRLTSIRPRLGPPAAARAAGRLNIRRCGGLTAGPRASLTRGHERVSRFSSGPARQTGPRWSSAATAL